MQLYKISFETTLKVYIGISRCAEQRLKQHCRNKKKSLITNAIRKYGNPILTILEESDNWEELCLFEQVAILEHNSIAPYGYNLTQGGEGTLGCIPSIEARAKMSSAAKGKIVSDVTRSKLSDALKGRVISTEARAKIAAANKLRIVSEETRLKISNFNKGKIVSAETRAKLSASHKSKVKNI
jgi:group I intron endonuclease